MQGSPTQINTVLLGSSVIGPIPLPNLVSASEIRDPLSKARDPHYYERLQYHYSEESSATFSYHRRLSKSPLPGRKKSE